MYINTMACYSVLQLSNNTMFPIQGSIFINGHRMDDVRDWYISNTGYVLQLAMPYYEELTVRENLTLAAQMRLSFSIREKFERIEQVMNGVSMCLAPLKQ